MDRRILYALAAVFLTLSVGRVLAVWLTNMEITAEVVADTDKPDFWECSMETLNMTNGTAVTECQFYNPGEPKNLNFSISSMSVNSSYPAGCGYQEGIDFHLYIKVGASMYRELVDEYGFHTWELTVMHGNNTIVLKAVPHPLICPIHGNVTVRGVDW